MGYRANGLNQYVAVGGVQLAYDANGNMTRDESGRGFGYNDRNQLVMAGAVSLAYDPLGRLASVTGGAGGVQRFGYDGLNLIEELDGNGAVLRRYVHGPGVDEPLVWYEGATLASKRWLHADERGSVIGWSGSSGSMIATRSYDEWGVMSDAAAVTGGAGGRFGYTGQAWVPELGLYYYKARYYSPTLGRFVSADPIGAAGGINLYDYTRGDPVNASDPLGLSTHIPQSCMSTSGFHIDCGGSSGPPSPQPGGEREGFVDIVVTARPREPEGNGSIVRIPVLTGAPDSGQIPQGGMEPPGNGGGGALQDDTSPGERSQSDRKVKLQRLRQLRTQLQYCKTDCRTKANEYFALNRALGSIDRINEVGVAWDLTFLFLNSVAGAGNGIRVVMGIFGGVGSGMPKPQPEGY